jgi:hypothetical protein
MKLLLKRIYTCKDYTIGHLYINNKYFCDTLEDVDRGLDCSMPLAKLKQLKVANVTAIPTGTYTILMNVVSPKYSKRQYYMDICKGMVPRLANVPAYEGVLIHVGNIAADTSGCILVGLNKAKGKVLSSRIIFENLYPLLRKAADNGESITITIERDY